MGHDVGPAYSPVGTTKADSDWVDVSRYARRLSVGVSVVMDAELFGILVTRRPDAKIATLSSYEEGRLLDVLVHMREALPRSDESGGEFHIWAISSDAGDAKARVHWVTMKRNTDGGNYRLSMSDA
jgi:hypothetical protein